MGCWWGRGKLRPTGPNRREQSNWPVVGTTPTDGTGEWPVQVGPTEAATPGTSNANVPLVTSTTVDDDTRCVA
uniref:Uncharacterized protein n=1 Tax=Oryza glumipatula TaxID=40148 RepID=A0A0D9ZZ90_9ORYZ